MQQNDVIFLKIIYQKSNGNSTPTCIYNIRIRTFNPSLFKINFNFFFLQTNAKANPLLEDTKSQTCKKCKEHKQKSKPTNAHIPLIHEWVQTCAKWIPTSLRMCLCKREKFTSFIKKHHERLAALPVPSRSNSVQCIARCTTPAFTAHMFHINLLDFVFITRRFEFPKSGKRDKSV